MEHVGWLEFDGDFGGEDEGSETDFGVGGGDGEFGGELEDYAEGVAVGDDVGGCRFDGAAAGFERGLVFNGTGMEGGVCGKGAGYSGDGNGVGRCHGWLAKGSAGFQDGPGAFPGDGEGNGTGVGRHASVRVRVTGG